MIIDNKDEILKLFFFSYNTALHSLYLFEWKSQRIDLKIKIIVEFINRKNILNYFTLLFPS